MHTPSILEYSWKRDKKSLSFTLNTFKCDRFESLLPVEQNVFFSLICMLCSNLAEDVGPLPLAVDRRGLDDELDLGQIAATAAGVPVHDVPSWLRSSKNADSGRGRSRGREFQNMRTLSCRDTYTFTHSPLRRTLHRLMMLIMMTLDCKSPDGGDSGAHATPVGAATAGGGGGGGGVVVFSRASGQSILIYLFAEY